MKLLRYVLGLVLIVSLVGCSAKQRHYAIVADYAFATAVTLASNVAYEECTNHTIPADTCNNVLKPQFIAIQTNVQAVTLALRSLPPDAPMPKALPDLLRSLNQFHATLDALGTTTNPQVTRLVGLVNDAIDKVGQVLYVFTAITGGN